MDSKDLVNRFKQHVLNSDEIEKTELIRSVALSFSAVLNDLVPEGREKALAITHLEEVVFWGNAGIARQSGTD